MKTEIAGSKVKTVKIYYEDTPADWTEFFRQAAKQHGVDPESPAVRFMAIPQGWERER